LGKGVMDKAVSYTRTNNTHKRYQRTMRKTHLELFKEILGDGFIYLEKFYKEISLLDTHDRHPLHEQIFERIFPHDTCSVLFGTPDVDRSTRIQRKMDLAVIREIYHLWKDKNYFDLSPQLCSLLIDADLKDVDTFFLRATYRSLYLSLPKGTGLMIPNVQTGLHEVESIYITFDDYEEPQNIIVPNKGTILNNATKHVHMLICGEQKGMFGDAILFFDLIFFEGKISDSIDINKELLDRPNTWDYIVEVFNFVTKVLLYINCANVSILKIAGMDIEKKLRELKNPAKKRKFLQKFTKISPQSHSYLDVTISHDPDDTSKPGGPHTFRGTKSLEKVRSHFKTQKFGPGRADSKIILVQSYVRGEGAEFFKQKRTFKVT
jgi:hypothetical protein